MDVPVPQSAVATQSHLQAAASRFKDLLGGIFKEVCAYPPLSSTPWFDVCTSSGTHLWQKAQRPAIIWSITPGYDRATKRLCCHAEPQRKPWAELFDRTAFSRPTSLSEVSVTASCICQVLQKASSLISLLWRPPSHSALL